VQVGQALSPASFGAALLLLLLASLCCAQTAISPPLIGTIRDSTGHLHKVYGTAGAFVLGPPEAATDPGRHIPIGELQMSGRTIRLDKAALVIRTADGQEKRVPLPSPAGELQRMGDGWLYAAPFAIRLTADGAQVFRLPAAEVAR